MDAESAIERMTDELLDILSNDLTPTHFRQKALIRQYLGMAYTIGRDRRVHPATQTWPHSLKFPEKSPEEMLPNSIKIKYAKRQAV